MFFIRIGVDRNGSVGPYIQSERLPIYQKYAEQLVLVIWRRKAYYSQNRTDLRTAVSVRLKIVGREILNTTITVRALAYQWRMQSSAGRWERNAPFVCECPILPLC